VAEDVAKAAGKPLPANMISPSTAPAVTSAAPIAALPTAAPPAGVPVAKITPFNTLQQAVNRNMMASLALPTFRTGYTITTDSLDLLYQQLKSKGVTMTALLAKAVAVTLAQHPAVNASYTDQGIQQHGAINIAVAVAMPGGGLITPVLANADRMDIYSLSRSWKDLVDRARLKQLQPAEYSSGTFTLSNLGMFGVDRFDAILPPGTGAILAIGASQPTVVATAEGAIAVRRQMQVNMTADHRIIYGADAASFLQDLAKLLETNASSLTM
jgi:pyruvate dehydrogenase E2 component (dihydrolipoamide acetyltransferase)